MSNNPFWSPELNQLKAYVPGEQPIGKEAASPVIKLNANENPYPPSPRARAVLADKSLIDSLRLYPDPQASTLCKTIANRYQLKSEQVFVGNGSDEVLAHSFYSFFKRPEPLLFPEIGYGFYPIYCQLYQISHHSPALREDFTIDLAGYARPAAGVILANPNAPTGKYLALEKIVQLLQMHPDRVVIIDEAYIDFGGESAIRLIPDYPNLLVIRTLSKSSGLAGLRLGYALGQAHLIEGLERTKNAFNPFPVDGIAQRVATEAIADQAWLETHCAKIIATRERVCRQLATLRFTIEPSLTNFVLAKPPEISAQALYLALRQRNILVRYFQQPRIDDYVRITIGTDTEMDDFLRACKDILTG
ncbi:MAG: histidinol-phosphate transaminase [Gammaproteobacteria bacterium]|nr:histidinol-phosphate transaminase [Gammaproteobacteria bacterium]